MIGHLKTYQQDASQTKNENHISNYSDKDMALNKITSLDKLESSSRNKIEDTVIPQTKKRSNSSASLDDKITKEQQRKEIMIINNKLISENWSVSSMPAHGGSTTTILLDGDCIPRKN